VCGRLCCCPDADDSIDFTRLQDQVDALIASSLHGLYTHGTAGEFQTLTEDEFDRVNELLATACTCADLPFQLGASHPSGQLSLDRVRRSAALGPSAIQVILPDWLPLNDRAALAFLTRVAATAGDVPLVLYNPPHAKTQVSPGQLAHLARAVPTLVGLKAAGGDREWFDQAKESGVVDLRARAFPGEHDAARCARQLLERRRVVTARSGQVVRADPHRSGGSAGGGEADWGVLRAAHRAAAKCGAVEPGAGQVPGCGR
jgi:dihydrodipicolinate synthase/N-acetylneuraminate lyase